MKFIITVDTEADNQWKSNEVFLKNIFSLPRFQSLCEKFSFIPTYLVSYEVAEDRLAVLMLKDWQNRGKAEIGAHLHPWTTPPILKDDKLHTYPFELSDEDLYAKIKNLTDLITKECDRAPTSYRAGRWGFDRRQAEILSKLGYLVDCSVTPKVDWRKNKGKIQGGPDFRLKPIYPEYVNGLLEVPMTIVFTGLFKKEGGIMEKTFLSLPDDFVKKVMNKLLFKQKWLRIFSNCKKDDWQKIYKSAVKNNLPVLEFMIHSSELMPGGSPYAKDEKAVEFIYYQLEEMFKYFKQRQVEGISLSEFAQSFKK